MRPDVAIRGSSVWDRDQGYLDGRRLVLGRKTGKWVTSLYADLFHRPKISSTNQIAVTKAIHS